MGLVLEHKETCQVSSLVLSRTTDYMNCMLRTTVECRALMNLKYY